MGSVQGKVGCLHSLEASQAVSWNDLNEVNENLQCSFTKVCNVETVSFRNYAKSANMRDASMVVDKRGAETTVQAIRRNCAGFAQNWRTEPTQSLADLANAVFVAIGCHLPKGQLQSAKNITRFSYKAQDPKL